MYDVKEFAKLFAAEHSHESKSIAYVYHRTMLRQITSGAEFSIRYGGGNFIVYVKHPSNGYLTIFEASTETLCRKFIKEVREDK